MSLLPSTTETTMTPGSRTFMIVASVLVMATPLPAQDRFFTSDGVRIRYVEQGEGEPVILVHGYTGSAESWVTSGFLADLARDHRVIALDLRGHGRSGKPHDPARYGQAMCLDVIRLMDHLGLSQAHIVGYSQGARILGYLLTTHPGRIRSATLGGSPPRVGWPADEAARAEREAQAMEQRASIGEASGQDYVALAAVARSRSLQVVTEAQLQQVTVPTLGIVGSADPRMAGMNALTGLMPAMQRLVVIDGADHGEAPRRPEFMQAVREFLARHDP
jgi:pimeloyl-ACP methyl ester carboxylesterase